MAESVIESLSIDLSPLYYKLGWQPPYSIKQGLEKALRR
jgi:hypothetical protein